MTKLKMPEKTRAMRLQRTTLSPAKWRMRTKGTCPITLSLGEEPDAKAKEGFIKLASLIKENSPVINVNPYKIILVSGKTFFARIKIRAVSICRIQPFFVI